jgi:FKBP-type peptidyl-prolyl cis-trans isomerase FklB
MTYLVTMILSILFLFSVCHAQEKLELKDQKDKESYSLGYQFGQNLKFQGVDVNLDIYTSGIKDALAGKEPQMSQEEIRATITGLQQKLQVAKQKALKEQTEKNLSESQTFLEENKKKEGVNTLPNGLQYKVLTEGSGKTPKADDTVTVNYRGTLIDGTEFDSSYSRNEPAEFEVGGVIPGWTEGLQLMKVGGKYRLWVPSKLAYGARGAGRVIGPNTMLIFEVEPLEVAK